MIARKPELLLNQDSPLVNNKSTLPLPEKALRTLASSIFQQLREEGCQPKDIISVSSQLLGLVSNALEKDIA